MLYIEPDYHFCAGRRESNGHTVLRYRITAIHGMLQELEKVSHLDRHNKITWLIDKFRSGDIFYDITLFFDQLDGDPS